MASTVLAVEWLATGPQTDTLLFEFRRQRSESSDALVVRDLGDHAAEVGVQVGRNAETRRGEIAHAIGTLGVAAAAVVLAVVALYVIGPVSLPETASWRGHLALSLVLVALLSFAVVLGRE